MRYASITLRPRKTPVLLQPARPQASSYTSGRCLSPGTCVPPIDKTQQNPNPRKIKYPTTHDLDVRLDRRKSLVQRLQREQIMTSQIPSEDVLQPDEINDKPFYTHKTTQDVQIHPGKLVPLRTLDELKAAVQTTEIYILPIPAKSVNSVLNSLRELLPEFHPLQHLRRLVKPSFLPVSVVEKIPPITTTKSAVMYMLVCPTEAIALPGLQSFLSALPVFTEDGAEGPQINIISVPSCQPISAAQAQEWSEKYWPVVYKRGNPYGPHPAIVENAANKLGRAGEYIQLARRAGAAVADLDIGEPFGCVIVNPETGEVVAAAGDGRCKGDKEWGNPLNHAVMRAVAMVAQKRLGTGEEVIPNNPCKPLTELERIYFEAKTTTTTTTIAPFELGETVDNGEKRENGENAEGYLCHNMHVYLSHEPCVMCAMALLHSRVGVVVFGQKVPKTGALMAEGEDGEVTGYGLFWRGELNWKFLCWQWVDELHEEIDEGISV